MPAPLTIASGAIRKLLDGLEAIALDPQDVCVAAGTSPSIADDADSRVPLDVLHALWGVVHARRPLPGLGLGWARHYAPGDYGLVGFICVTAATLREGIRQLVRYSRLWTDSPVMLFDDTAIVLRHISPSLDCVGRRLATESALAELLHGARVLTERPDLTPAAIEIGHSAPDDTATHRAFFGVQPMFGAPRTAIVFSPETLETPLRRADPKLGAFLCELGNAALARRDDPDSVVSRVRGCVAEMLASGVPDASEVARQLAMSERTLRRRLDEEGSGFRTIVDNTRAELARTYASDHRLTLGEIAFLLGYAEQSAFQRAFKRWTGQTPATWRATAASARRP